MNTYIYICLFKLEKHDSINIAFVLVKYQINIDDVIQREGCKNDEIDERELRKKLQQWPVWCGQQPRDHAHQRWDTQQCYPIHFLLLSVFSHSIGRFVFIAFHLQWKSKTEHINTSHCETAIIYYIATLCLSFRSFCRQNADGVGNTRTSHDIFYWIESEKKPFASKDKILPICQDNLSLLQRTRIWVQFKI